MTSADDVSAPFQDPSTGQWYQYDFSTGTTQPATDPNAASSNSGAVAPSSAAGDSSATPATDPVTATEPTPTAAGPADLTAEAFGVDPTATTTSGTPTDAPTQTDPTTVAPASSDASGSGATGTSDAPTSVAQAPEADTSQAGTWVQLRTGGTDDAPELEPAVITAAHENPGSDGWSYLYVFPRQGMAYPAVAMKGDGQDQYR